MNTTLPPKLLAFVLSLMLPAVAAAQTSQLADDYNSRGLAKETKGDHDGAIADYNRAIELDPKHSRAYRNRRLANQDKGVHHPAVVHHPSLHDAVPIYMSTTQQPKLDEFVVSVVYPPVAEAQTSHSADDYSSRGLAKEAKGDHDGAIADYSRAIELDPGNH